MFRRLRPAYEGRDLGARISFRGVKCGADRPFVGQKILTRTLLPYWPVDSGKKDLLKDSLLRAGFAPTEDFQIVDSTTTIYKANSAEPVFVVDEKGDVREVAEQSDMISTLRDRPEAESLLIVINDRWKKEIKAIARNSNFVV